MLKLKDLALIFGTVGFFTLGLLLTVPYMFQESALINNLDVTCQCPDKFTDNMVAFANRYCKNELVKNNAYVEFPLPGYSRIRYGFYEDLKEEQRQKQAIVIIVIFDLLIVFGLYTLVSIGHQDDGPVWKIVQILGHVIAIMFFFSASFIPLIIHSTRELSIFAKSSESNSGEFTCEVITLRNTKNTVKCIHSLLQLHGSDQGVGAYLNLHGIVCGVMVILCIGSFISMFTSKPKKDAKKEEIMLS